MSDKASQSIALTDWLTKLELLNPSHIELGLERSRAVLERMNLSFHAKIVMVAGTNGKGTTVSILEKLLSEKGFSTGAYTSPHIFHFRERIRIKCEVMTDAQLVVAFEAVEVARGDIRLTYFEFATLAAAYLFSQSNLDFWLMEVGLGGRLDAVNLFEPDVAVVTNIGLDHQDWLGDTLEQIATEKAGIFRAGKPAIYGTQNRPDSIDSVIGEVNARPVLAGQDFGIEDGFFWWGNKTQSEIELPCGDTFAPEVLSSVLAILKELGCMPSERELFSLKDFSIPGRFQVITSKELKLIIDVAHNADSVAFLARRLAERKATNLTAVVGFMEDKLGPELIEPMSGLVDQWVLVRPEISRAADLDSIKELLNNAGVPEQNILSCPHVRELNETLKGCGTAVIYGSFYTVGECLPVLGVELG